MGTFPFLGPFRFLLAFTVVPSAYFFLWREVLLLGEKMSINLVLLVLLNVKTWGLFHFWDRLGFF
jgi:hypothetical protein